MLRYSWRLVPAGKLPIAENKIIIVIPHNNYVNINVIIEMLVALYILLLRMVKNMNCGLHWDKILYQN